MKNPYSLLKSILVSTIKNIKSLKEVYENYSPNEEILKEIEGIQSCINDQKVILWKQDLESIKRKLKRSKGVRLGAQEVIIERDFFGELVGLSFTLKKEGWVCDTEIAFAEVVSNTVPYLYI